MYGEKIATESVSIEGFREKVNVDIYDGLAIGYTKSGKQVMLEFPKLAVVKAGKKLTDELMEFLPDIKTVEEITPIQVMQTFATMYVDGTELKVKTKNKK